MNLKHPNLVKIGGLIRNARKKQGLSQESLAEKAGLGRTYMGRVERGEQNLSIQNLISVALALRLEIGSLIPPIAKLELPKSKISYA